jgi:TonB family protein
MNRYSRQALAMVMSGALSVCLSAQDTPVKVDPWVPTVGARAATELDALVVRSGAVRTNRLYSDFVFMFEFRLLDARSEGSVLVRSRFGYGNGPTTVFGYRVALTGRAEGKDVLGRVSAAEMHLRETLFQPARALPTPAEWQECEIRAERDTITVKVNGAVVSIIQDVDEFAGYLALESTESNLNSGIAFRNLRAIRLTQAHEPFGQGAHRLPELGVVLPQQLDAPRPFYPREPFDARIEGAVGLEVVVQANGSVGDVRVVKPVNPDLDEAAVACARRWRFKPATKDGQPLDLIVALEITFKIGR